MPRQVDHDRRRHQIAEAVWRLAARGGLEDVTLRQVATEAGVSARLLQYYFGTRDELLLGALEILNDDAEQRARERLAMLGDAPGMHAVVRGVLLELLPLDAERRNRHLVYAAYFVRFLADPALAKVARAAPPALENLVAGLIAQGQGLGQVSRDVDAEAEAAFLVAGADGIQATVLLGQRTPEEAVALIDHQLARVFTVTVRS
ncbi:TetR/AcrR family transcriptional regulator [Streptosporangium roseum]|uniref:Transcriptional regulator n=1 Tax=Streptosporangium roseum (strain ATCC 12428 / DSM 43021 / JCM 3005 / KCTC 9067 / NCIMB 10171 / NRRL 2505 / NI 9100) TaxID=479432 RepID=D2BAI9_STRRD|nr:TetR family transcriptional regulator C-terminal domain-containing protein [Streptosporangium roseum]ACZ89819.1 transcriptional regulator [Streptosporangium roseum DSM 43021]